METTRDWYHRWIYQQAKQEVNMPEHQPKREIRNPARYAIDIMYQHDANILATGESDYILPLSECGKYFTYEVKGAMRHTHYVSILAAPEIIVVARRI